MSEKQSKSSRAPFPTGGATWEEIKTTMNDLVKNDIDWRDGRTPLYVFHATEAANDIGKRGFMKFFSENALGGKRAFFGLKKMEDDIIDFGLDLLNGPAGSGGMTSTGGSESILIGVKAARDFARSQHRGNKPFNIVVPYSAHPAFDKAGGLMDIEIRRANIGIELRADVTAMEAMIDEQTIMMVGSAPCFPHGVVDPIDDISALALERDIWLHVDACVGGYLIPFLQKAGRSIPNFDFNIPGVRSISADLHKFGFCPKPISTLFFRHAEDLERVTFKFDDWPNGLFSTATIAGTRAGGAIAGSWAVLNHLGVSGYTSNAEKMAEMTDRYVLGIEAIEGFHMLAKPDATIINFGSSDYDIFAVAEKLSEHGWLPGLTKDPKGMHAMMSMFHEPAREQYLNDLEAAANHVRVNNLDGSNITASY
jgi:sphinganine-1-phosphate aldolase